MKNVAVGMSHCMLVEENGSLWSFGLNKNGCLAIGDSFNKKKPY